MSQIKATSTNQLNKKTVLFECPITYALEKFGGRWKPIIIFNLMDGPKRYSEIKKRIPTITEKMLIQHIRQLETDGLVVRKVLQVIPAHVEYSLSKSGRELIPVMAAMKDWAFRQKRGAKKMLAVA